MTAGLRADEIRVRAAAPADCDTLACPINQAGHRLPYCLWSEMTAPGQDPWALGRERARRDDGGFSYRNGTIAEIDATVAGGLIGCPLEAHPEDVDPDAAPPMFLPVLELEYIAAGTWYINAVAALPPFRGRGVAA